MYFNVCFQSNLGNGYYLTLVKSDADDVVDNTKYPEKRDVNAALDDVMVIDQENKFCFRVTN